MRDADVRFHQEWLGLAQPVEGLLFSVPALADAQIAPKIRPGLTVELEAQLEDTDDGVALRDVRAFFETFLGYSRPGMLVEREQLPADIRFYAQEGRQEIRPSFAIARGPFEDGADDPFAEFQAAPGPSESESSDDRSPCIALVWDLSTDAGASAIGIDLDEKETQTGPWRYPPTAKLERLLRQTGIPIGFVSNGRELRIVYAPAGESSAHLTFRFKDLAERAGRPLVAALELLFHAERTYGAAPEFTFAGLLRDSRLRQADVTKDLAAQVFEAVEILLEGFEHAAARDCVGNRPDWLRAALEEPGDHFYQGILSVVLRLVFILYAEDQSLLPVHQPTYRDHLSILGLYQSLSDDAGSHPESMHLRFGAYGRLIALFRVIFLGVHREDLQLPPRRGKLFDPSAFPFLEGGLPGWTAAIVLPKERAAVQLPSIDDNTIHRVLHRLVVFKGQRLSYRSLDVEQIGSVYESLMGYQVLRLESPAVRLGKERVWAATATVRAMQPTERKRFWKINCGLSPGAVKVAEEAVKNAPNPVALAELLGELAPGRKSKKTRHRAAAGRLVLQPDEERRRTGSHYTPRWLSEKVVKRTLEPIFACLGEDRTAEQILNLKICDPAMGSGAFLVAACRLLAEEVVQAWDRAEQTTSLTEEHGDALLHARRLVAQRCLYGVDKNAAAVELAKLSLWLVTLSRQLPFTFLDHALRHGDSLVGLDLDQIRSFHWEPTEQLETCQRALADALEQGLEHRDHILDLANRDDADSQREKLRLLEYAEQSMSKIRTIADVCVGAFFTADKPRVREQERLRRLAMVEEWLAGDEVSGVELLAMQAEMQRVVPVFHWMLEFPEIFYEERPDPLAGQRVNQVAQMDSFVGNPPFMGGTEITRHFGAPRYVHWLKTACPEAFTTTDLCAYFVRTSLRLLGDHGTQGFIVTNSISEGDTRNASLKPALKLGAELLHATRNTPWPGEAAVLVSTIVMGVGAVAKNDDLNKSLDDEFTDFINSRLESKPEREDPARLAAQRGFSFVGTSLGSNGFVLEPDEAEALLASEPSASEVIQPFIGGKEVNSSPHGHHARYVINFRSRPLNYAERFPQLLEIVRQRVKPARDRGKSHGPGIHGKKYWWQHTLRADPLYEAIRETQRCLVTSEVAKHLCFSFQPTERCFSKQLIVFPFEAFGPFAVLQSRIHEVWARLLSSSMKTDLRYAASDCFETFPFPQPDPRTVIDSLEIMGEKVYDARASYMGDSDQGLTKTYNALKDPDDHGPCVVELRLLHEEMDRTVLEAYGWTDISVPPFCPSSEEDLVALQEFTNEVIDRLYVLNAERACEEQPVGATTSKGRRASRRTKESKRSATPETSDKQEELF